MDYLRPTLLALSTFLVLGCGSDDPEPGTCEAAYTLMCERACDCATDGSCIIASGGVTITHDNRGDCDFFWVGLGCPPEENTIDFVACEAALESAMCVATTDNMGVDLPDACNDGS